jgi:hypothetical protein
METPQTHPSAGEYCSPPLGGSPAIARQTLSKNGILWVAIYEIINYRVLRNYIIPFLFFGTKYCVFSVQSTVFFQYLNYSFVFYPINDENKFTKCCEAVRGTVEIYARSSR